MPEQETLERARRDRAEGKAPSTQAGEFIREEMHHIREGKHGARSTKQAIAIGLSKARRAGVKLPPPEKGKASAETRRSAARDYAKGRSGTGKRQSPRRARAITTADVQKAVTNELRLARQAQKCAPATLDSAKTAIWVGSGREQELR
jgi:hypothetical protein